MKTQIVKLLLICLLFSGATPLMAEELTDAKRADIKRLLDVTNALAFGKQMSEMVSASMTKAIQTNRPDIPPKMFDILREEVDSIIEQHLPALAEQIIPNYHKHFTHAEIKKIIAFYETDIGKKVIQAMPVLFREGMAIGQEWGKGLGPEIQKRIMQRFKAEGVDLSA